MWRRNARFCDRMLTNCIFVMLGPRGFKSIMAKHSNVPECQVALTLCEVTTEPVRCTTYPQGRGLVNNNCNKIEKKKPNKIY